MHRGALAGVIAALVVLSAVPVPASAQLLGASSSSSSLGIQQVGVDGTLQPTFVVELTNGSESSIRDWAESDTTRRLVSIDEDANVATVAAPTPMVHGPSVTFDGFEPKLFIGTQLESFDYIDAVHVNYRVSLDRPDPLRASQFTAPTEGWFSWDDPDFATAGMAFSGDVNATNLSVARRTVGANNISSHGMGRRPAIIDTGVNVADGVVFGDGTAGSDIRILNASANVLGRNVTTVANTSYDVLEDETGHGTWTASAIIANTSDPAYDGLMPSADALVVKALSEDGGSVADIAQAIRYAARHDATGISMSLGSTVRSGAIEAAIDYAHDHGVQAVFVAAGNSRVHRGANLASPADYEPVLTVGATTSGDGTAADVQSAYFSQVGPEPSSGDFAGPTDPNLGATIDVSAPGMEIRAMTPSVSGEVTPSALSGTSMATPIAYGAWGRAASANSDLADADHETVHNRVRETARVAPNLSVTETGAGVIASDNLATGTVPERDQPAVQTTAAEQRTAFYRALSDGDDRRDGGWLAGHLG